MHRRTLVLILCLAAMATAGFAAADRPPMVGLAPFHGPQGSYTHAVPFFIYWQFSHIPGIRRVDMSAMVSCVELDRLTVPKKLSDTASYSKLAVATGVDYLVTGQVDEQSKSRLRYRLAVYSAANPTFRSERSYECALVNLIDESASSAKDIAEVVGVEPDSKIEYDNKKVDLKALRLMDESVRLGTGCERDKAALGESSRIAQRASTLCPKSPLVAQWAQSYIVEVPRGFEGYRELRQRSMRSLVIVDGSRRWSRWRAGTRTSGQGTAFDRVQVGQNGEPVLSSSWRNDLVTYHFRNRGSATAPSEDMKAYRRVLNALMARRPDSAYIQYSAASYLSRIDEMADCRVACERAAKINPQSFRLQMELIRSYIGSYKNSEAVSVLKPALKRWPDSTECHFYAAVLYRRWKQYDKAAEQIETVQRIDPEADGIHDLLSQDYLRTGKFVEAVQEMAEGDPNLRRGMIMFSMVLSAIFVVVALVIAVLAHLMLRPERRPVSVRR